ncbi:MAG: hypothetical protein KGI08_11540 [Thaumarchaeota archaeon]|nr:hypothetical protein [Nitrososphaerota archaeon]
MKNKNARPYTSYNFIKEQPLTFDTRNKYGFPQEKLKEFPNHQPDLFDIETMKEAAVNNGKFPPGTDIPEDVHPVYYLIGSLRNPKIIETGNYLRSLGFEVFDDWIAAGPTADDSWQEYEVARGHNYKEAMKGYAAKHVFEFDKHHLDRCTGAILMLPAGKSGHLELGYIIGQGKPGYILLEGEPERFDQMYQFAKDVFYNKEELGKAMVKEHTSTKLYKWKARS